MCVIVADRNGMLLLIHIKKENNFLAYCLLNLDEGYRAIDNVDDEVKT